MTIVELAVTGGLLMTVLVSLLGVFTTAQTTAAFTQERSEVLESMRLAMNRVSKEVRQATAIDSSSTASRLQVDTFVLAQAKTIRYEVVGTELRRTVVGQSGSVVLQDQLDTTSIFTYTLPASTSPVAEAKVVTVTLAVAPKRNPETVLRLTSEIRLRNASGEG